MMPIDTERLKNIEAMLVRLMLVQCSELVGLIALLTDVLNHDQIAEICEKMNRNMKAHKAFLDEHYPGLGETKQ